VGRNTRRPPLLTVRDVAEILSVSRATVYRLVDTGELMHVRVANSIRIPAGGLETYLFRDP